VDRVGSSSARAGKTRYQSPEQANNATISATAMFGVFLYWQLYIREYCTFFVLV